MRKLLLTIIILLFASPVWGAADGDLIADGVAWLNWHTSGSPATSNRAETIQHIDDQYNASRYTSDVAKLNTDCGVWPASIGNGVKDSPGDLQSIAQQCIDYWNAGGGPCWIDWHPCNPFGSDMNVACASGYEYDSNIPSGKDLNDLWDSGEDAFARMQTAFQSIADNFITPLSNAGIPVVFRLWHESNTGSFWWSYNSDAGKWTHTDWKSLYEKTFDYFSTTTVVEWDEGGTNDYDFDNIIWSLNVGFGGASSGSDADGVSGEMIPTKGVDIVTGDYYLTNAFPNWNSSTYSSTWWNCDAGDNECSWTQEGASSEWYTTTGKPYSVRENSPSATTYTAGTCGSLNTDQYCYDDDTRKLTVRTGDSSDPSDNDIEVLYYRLPAGLWDEFSGTSIAGSKPIGFGEVGFKAAGTYDGTRSYEAGNNLATQHASGGAFEESRFIMAWWSNNSSFVDAAANDGTPCAWIGGSTILVRSELVPDTPAVSAPAQGASGVATYPTVTSSTFYGPRAHYQTQRQIDAVSNGDTDCSTADWTGLAIDNTTAQSGELITKSSWPSQLSDNSYYCVRVRYGINVNGSATWGDWSANTVDSQYDGNYFTTGVGGGDPELSGNMIGLGGSKTVGMGGSKTLKLISE